MTDCPVDLLRAPYTEVYRETTERGQCGWIDCETGTSHGRFCDLHRRWHAARLLHQLKSASAAALRSTVEGGQW